jgi:hypothetical protein
VWIQACEQWATLFQHVMPMDMQNLAIAQHWDTLCYAIIHGGGYQLQIQRFEWKDYVYFQQITPITLNVIIGCVIYVRGRFYLLECCCWRAKMVKHGRTMCAIMHHVIFPMWMAKWSHP